MENINTIAKDIAIETFQQKEKLLKIDEEMKQADKNAEEALDELTQAKDNKKKTAKCNLFMVGICVFSLVVASIVVLCS